MAGIEFDRQVFAPTAAETENRTSPKIFGTLALVVALGLAGLVGYKIFTQVSQQRALAEANAQIEQLQLQLADSQKQMEDVQKRHKPAAKVEAPAPVVTPAATVKAPAAPRTYHVAAASVLPPQPAKLQSIAPTSVPPANSAETAAMKSELAANHEAWQATTDRLADVVGVVGQQQSEISETREAVNQLLSQTKRQAVSFELRRGTSQLPVGPVSLQLKSVDMKSQRYSVCVYFQERCTELKDRSLNEVVVFIVSKDRGAMELVATKILHDQVVGYLQVPVEPQKAQ
jgi:hypothetical protein